MAMKCCCCSPPTRCTAFTRKWPAREVREIPYRAQKLAFPLDELLDAITPRHTRRPDRQPEQSYRHRHLALDGIERILEKAASAAVLIDEAYFEFSGVTALPLISDYPNLFVSRTFSKVYGMAAMRLGCLFSQSGNVDSCTKRNRLTA